MRFVLTRDPEEFAERAGVLFASRIEFNVLATVLANVADGHHAAVSPLFAYADAAVGTTVAAALRVPPWPLLST